MAGAANDDIKGIPVVEHGVSQNRKYRRGASSDASELFADTEGREQVVQHPLIVDSTRDFPESGQHSAEIAGDELYRAGVFEFRLGRLQKFSRQIQRMRVAGID